MEFSHPFRISLISAFPLFMVVFLSSGPRLTILSFPCMIFRIREVELMGVEIHVVLLRRASPIFVPLRNHTYRVASHSPR